MTTGKKITVTAPVNRRRRRVLKRRYSPSIYSIHHILDMLPADLELVKIRETLRKLVDDEELWDRLQDARELSEGLRSKGERISKMLKKYNLK